MAFRLEIDGNYFVITDTVSGISHNAHASKTVFNGNNGRYKFQHSDGNDNIFEGISIINFADIVDSGGAAFTSEADMKLWLRMVTGSSGGGTGGAGDASQAQQIISNTRLQEIATDMAALEVLDTAENVKLDDLITRLTNIDTRDATALTELIAVKTELQGLNTNTDEVEGKLDTLKTEGDETQSAIQAAEAAQLLRDADQLSKLEEVNQQTKTQGEAIVAALNGQTEAPTRTFGRDDNNNTVIIQEISPDGTTITYKDASTGTAYTLTGNFVPDATLEASYGIVTTFLRVKTNNITGGYSVNDIIEKIEVIDPSLAPTNPNYIRSVSYRNTSTGMDLVTANVVETDLDGRLQIPQALFEELFHVVDAGVIQSNATKVFLDDQTFVWVDSTGNYVDSPISGNQELVRIYETKRYDDSAGYTFPHTFAANTLKYFDIAVDSNSSAEYTVQVGQSAPITINKETYGHTEGFNEQWDGWISEPIVITEVTAEPVRINATVPGTFAASVTPAQTVDAQLLIDVNSGFIIPADDFGQSASTGSIVTSVDNPVDSVVQKTFSVTAGQVLRDTLTNGRPGFKANVPTALTAQMNIDVFEAKDNAIYSIVGPADFTTNGALVRWRNPTIQVSVANSATDISYSIGTGFQTRPIGDLNLTTNELNGTSAVIITVERTTINGGADSQRELIFYTENNPTGFSFATVTIPYSTAATQLRSMTLGTMQMNYGGIVELNASKNNWIAALKTEGGLTF